MKKLIIYFLERLNSKHISISDPVLDETVNGICRRAIVLALMEGKQ